MISLEYLKYLFKSKRYILVLILLITLLNCIGNDKKSMIALQSVLTIILCFIIPILVFYYVHDKKAVDTFYSLPVSRKALLFTGLLFSLIVIYSPMFMSILVYAIKSWGNPLEIALYIIDSFIGVNALIIFNTCIYLAANNSLDGIIILIAYSLFPLAVYAIARNFVSNYICGMYSIYTFDDFAYFSPTYLCFDQMYSLTVVENVKYKLSLSTLVLIIYVVVFLTILYRSFINRNVERASTPSNGLFTYPLIISIYLILSLFSFVMTYEPNSNYSVLGFIFTNFISYILLFAVYIAAHFIHKRKLYFDYKMPLLYIIATIVAVILINATIKTQGFGLPRQYDKDNKRIYFNYDIIEQNVDESVKNKIFEIEKEKSDYIEVNIVAGSESYLLEISQNTLNTINQLREKSIDDFYSSHDIYSRYYNNIRITTANDKLKTDKVYHYTLYENSLTFDDLSNLLQDKTVKITIFTDKASYRLSKDGSINKMYDYE